MIGWNQIRQRQDRNIHDVDSRSHLSYTVRISCCKRHCRQRRHAKSPKLHRKSHHHHEYLSCTELLLRKGKQNVRSASKAAVKFVSIRSSEYINIRKRKNSIMFQSLCSARPASVLCICPPHHDLHPFIVVLLNTITQDIHHLPSKHQCSWASCCDATSSCCGSCAPCAPSCCGEGAQCAYHCHGVQKQKGQL